MESTVRNSAVDGETAQEGKSAGGNLPVDDLHRGPDIRVGERPRDGNAPLDGALDVAHPLHQPGQPAGIKRAESALECNVARKEGHLAPDEVDQGGKTGPGAGDFSLHGRRGDLQVIDPQFRPFPLQPCRQVERSGRRRLQGGGHLEEAEGEVDLPLRLFPGPGKGGGTLQRSREDVLLGKQKGEDPQVGNRRHDRQRYFAGREGIFSRRIEGKESGERDFPALRRPHFEALEPETLPPRIDDEQLAGDG